jgi:WS/DGAT/MGAT family acyltransferase
MHQFNPVDAALLYLESTRTPMHVSMVYMYDVSSCPDGPPSFDDIKEEIRACLPRVPQFRRKIVHSPMNADYPYWVEDGDFDFDYHMRHTSLPRPGGWREFRELMARVVSRPLDLTRPPWEVTVIEGINNVEGVAPGGFAICLKIHHCAIDGKSGVALANAMHHMTPEGRVRRVKDNWKPEPVPGRFGLATKTWLNNIRRSSRVSSMLLRNWTKLLSAGIKAQRAPDDEKSKFVVPKTIFSRKVSPHRIYDEASCSLNDVKMVRKAVEGATINDVAITIVAECMRNYLLERDALPEDSLVGIVPVAINLENADEIGGNQVSVTRISMRTDIADPIERLEAITQATRKMKIMQNGLVMKTMLDVVYNLPGQLVGLAARAAPLALNAAGMPANTMITNVPNSQLPLYFLGARMARSFGTAPLMDGGQVMHAVSSYCGEFIVNFTADREAFDNVDDYTGALAQAIKTVVAAAAKAIEAPAAKAIASPASGDKRKPRKRTAAGTSGQAAKAPATAARSGRSPA